MINRSRKLRTNNQRRTLLKKLHQRVLVRRKQFASSELNQEYEEAC